MLADKKKISSILLYVLVYGHLFSILTSTLPKPPPELGVGFKKQSTIESIILFPLNLLFWNQIHVVPTVSEYLRLTGLQQNWNMFAPYPIARNTFIDASVEFQDGTQKDIAYPRLKTMGGHWERFIKERYWKFVESAQSDDHAILWPALAGYLARKANTEIDNPPIKITLYRNYRNVAGPEEPQIEEFKKEKFFVTPITEKDLLRE